MEKKTSKNCRKAPTFSRDKKVWKKKRFSHHQIPVCAGKRTGRTKEPLQIRVGCTIQGTYKEVI